MHSIWVLLFASSFSIAEENKKTIGTQVKSKNQARSPSKRKSASFVLSKKDPAQVNRNHIKTTRKSQRTRSGTTSARHTQAAQSPTVQRHHRSASATDSTRKQGRKKTGTYHTPTTKAPTLKKKKRDVVPARERRSDWIRGSADDHPPVKTPTLKRKQKDFSPKTRSSRPQKNQSGSSTVHHAPKNKTPELTAQRDGFVLGGRVKNPSLQTEQGSSTSNKRRPTRNRSIGTSESYEENSTTTLRRERERDSIFQPTQTSTRSRRNRTYGGEDDSASTATPRQSKPRSTRKKKKRSCSTYRVGLRGGLHAGSLNVGAERVGSGFAFGYRPCNGMIGMELSHLSYGEEYNVDFDSPVQLSAQLYLSSGGLFSPFVSGGVSGAYHTASKDSLQPPGVAFGPHFGLGLQSKLGPFAVNVEGRYLKYNNTVLQPQLQAIAGIDLHF